MYADCAELRNRIGAAVFDEIYPGAESAPGGEDRSDAIADLQAAAAEIDGALIMRYTLPVTGPLSLALLKDWCLTLAEERAYARPVGGDFTEKVKRRTDQVRKYLDMLRAGQYLLPDAVEKGSSGSTGKIAIVQCDPPRFTRNQMEGF